MGKDQEEQKGYSRAVRGKEKEGLTSREQSRRDTVFHLGVKGGLFTHEMCIHNSEPRAGFKHGPKVKKK